MRGINSIIGPNGKDLAGKSLYPIKLSRYWRSHSRYYGMYKKPANCLKSRVAIEIWQIPKIAKENLQHKAIISSVGL